MLAVALVRVQWYLIFTSGIWYYHWNYCTIFQRTTINFYLQLKSIYFPFFLNFYFMLLMFPNGLLFNDNLPFKLFLSLSRVAYSGRVYGIYGSLFLFSYMASSSLSSNRFSYTSTNFSAVPSFLMDCVTDLNVTSKAIVWWRRTAYSNISCLVRNFLSLYKKLYVSCNLCIASMLFADLKQKSKLPSNRRLLTVTWSPDKWTHHGPNTSN